MALTTIRFRVFFGEGDTLDVDANDGDEARRLARAARPGFRIVKVKPQRSTA